MNNKWAKITKHSFSDSEKETINKAIKENDPWNDPSVEGIKTLIKNFHLSIQDHRCCYCQKEFTGEFRMLIDIEHVLPKSKFKPLTFDMRNLSVACKRCNMSMKKDSLEHLCNKNIAKTSYFSSDAYLIIHPNLDVYNDHLIRRNIDTERIRIVFYFVCDRSNKGAFTKEFFKLEELQIDSLNLAQGGVKAADCKTLSKEAEKIIDLLMKQ